MKLSLDWLRDSVDIDCTPEALVELMTLRIAEVEKLHCVGAPIRKAKIGIIEALRDHPSKPQLKIATVGLGNSKAEVVTGATNAKVGLVTAYVPPGGEIAVDDSTIKVEAREIAGVVSQGTLACEKELGIGPDQTGLFDIAAMTGLSADKLKAGAPLEGVVGEVDWVVEIENKSLTHRPDLWSHHGFGADLAAVFGSSVKRNPHQWADASPEGAALVKELSGKGDRAIRTIEIDPKTGCRRFTLLEIRDTSVTTTPYKYRRRLAAVGAGVRGLLVDLSNYVMHDVGVPNHVFDIRDLKGDAFVVRPAKKGEHLLCLDGIDHELVEDDIIVGDRTQAHSIAGIIGGQNSSVHGDTRDILLEAACWDPVRIRHSAKRHQIRTDASTRFEKNLSPYLPLLGQHRYVQLLREIDPKARIVGDLLDVFPLKPEKKTIAVSLPYFPQRMGVQVSDEKIISTLKSLRFDVQSKKDSTLEVTPPYDRAMAEITLQEDLLEEVARIFGIENIPATPPAGHALPVLRDKLWDLEHASRDLLRAVGFSESSNYSFMSSERGASFGFGESIKILNPIDKTQDVMRSALIPGLVEAVERNLRHTDVVPLFEIGRTYHPKPAHSNSDRADMPDAHAPHSQESRRAAIAIAGPKLGEAEFYGLLSVIRKLVAIETPAEVQFVRPTDGGKENPKDLSKSRNWQHPFRAATIIVGKTIVGTVAQVRTELLEVRQRNVIAAEIDLDALLTLDAGAARYVPFARFPESFFEISAVMPKHDEFRALEKLLGNAVPSGLLRRVEFLERYEGAQIGKDEKSVSVRLVFGSDERTLSGEEVRALQDSVMKGVQDGGYRIRGV